MYSPRPLPKEDLDLGRYVEQELQAIARGTSQTETFLLVPRHVEPERPREGLLAYADGSNWNPGEGKGVYVYNGTAWELMAGISNVVEDTSPTLGGDLDAAGFDVSNVDFIECNTVELGGTTDTTLSRSAAGIPACEGVAIATISATQTFTNKRITPRITSAASSATPTPHADNEDIFVLTALAAAAAFQTPGGTPVQGQKLVIRIKDNGTARALTWDAIYRAGDIALPTTTVLSKTLYLGFMYNSTDTKWDLLAKVDNI